MPREPPLWGPCGVCGPLGVVGLCRCRGPRLRRLGLRGLGFRGLFRPEENEAALKAALVEGRRLMLKPKQAKFASSLSCNSFKR